MARRFKVPISTARAKLFQLADVVRRSGDETVVVLEQRGRREPVALVREAHLAYLEQRDSQHRREDKPFTVAGSLASDLDDAALEALLRDIRRGWGARVPEELSYPPVGKRRRRG